MENIKLVLELVNDGYALTIYSKAKLSTDCINISILSMDDYEDKNDIIHLAIDKNQFFTMKEVGAYKNVIYINDVLYNEIDGPNAEIRLSLICLNNNNIGNIFIRAKKYL